MFLHAPKRIVGIVLKGMKSLALYLKSLIKKKMRYFFLTHKLLLPLSLLNYYVYKISWKCLRGQKQILTKEKQKSASSNQESITSENTTTDWLNNADDWGSDEDDDVNFSQNYSMVQNARGNSNLETNLSNLTLSTSHEGQTDPQFLQTSTTIQNENSKDFLTHPNDTTLLVDQDMNANPPELPGILKMH